MDRSFGLAGLSLGLGSSTEEFSGGQEMEAPAVVPSGSDRSRNVVCVKGVIHLLLFALVVVVVCALASRAPGGGLGPTRG